MTGVFLVLRLLLIGLCMIGGALLAATYGEASLHTLSLWLKVSKDEMPNFRSFGIQFGLIVVGTLTGAILGSELADMLAKMGRRLEDMETEEKISVFVGVPLGLLVSLVFYQMLLRVPVLGWLLCVLVTVISVFLFVTGINSIKEGWPWPGTKPGGRKRNIRIVDTNVIIDGRVGEIIKTGFLSGQIYVPGFVLDELQSIADSADALRRQRGRRGLDILNGLQKDGMVEVRVHDRLAHDTGEGVDSRLVQLARALNCDIVTNDFNLSKVAELQGVRVLNVNDLAVALKPNVMPGEAMQVQVIRDGKEHGQGIGYLEDGTMVVVEDAREEIGNTIPVNVTSVIQTVQGKMIFASPLREGGGDADGRGNSGRRPRR